MQDPYLPAGCTQAMLDRAMGADNECPKCGGVLGDCITCPGCAECKDCGHVVLCRSCVRYERARARDPESERWD